jgi:hypothetical protein
MAARFILAQNSIGLIGKVWINGVLRNRPLYLAYPSASVRQMAGWHIRAFSAGEIVRAKNVIGYAVSASSSAFASVRSGVSKPSVNQP